MRLRIFSPFSRILTNRLAKKLEIQIITTKMIIDECYENVVAKLTSQGKIIQVSSDLRSKTKNYERVLLVYDVFEDLNAFPKLEIVNKCEQLSLKYRNQGNQSYQRKDFFKAWQYYNISLLYAPMNSDTYYLAISNRSAVFFELHKYNECIKDVQYVLTLDIPDDFKEKIKKRLELCATELLKRTNLQNNDVAFANPTLKGERDSVYVCASTKLEVKYSKEMGRHVIAKEDIKVGEVLADEEPYIHLINKEQILFACNHCLSRDLNLLPCNNCCFSLYCSEECKSLAFNEYHKIECPLMATLIDMDFTKLELSALRIVIKARNDYEDWNGLFLTIDEAESNVGTKHHGQVKVDDKWIYDSKYYTSIHTLETNVDKRSVSDIFQKSVTAAVFLKFLEENTTFLNATNNEDVVKIKQTVAGTLLLHIMTVPTNAHNLSNMKNEEGKYIEEVSLASGVYAFHSLLNHSCAPNVVRFNTLGKKMTKLLAIRLIKKGMQLFDNYGMHHALADYPGRIQSLIFQYKFRCECEACVYKWPTYLSMQHTSRIPPNLKTMKSKLLTLNIIGQLQRGDKNTAIKVFDKLCKLCEDLEPHAPCRELCDCQESLKQCLVIFGGLLPFGHSQTITWDAVLK